MVSFVAPGSVMEMAPPQAHMHLLELLRAGILPTVTVGQPGAQGATVTGTQGMGVSTPRAAAVAEATWGLEGVMQLPKLEILAMGAKSMMVAAGFPSILTILEGMTVREPGAVPMVHMSFAPVTTGRAMMCFLLGRVGPLGV